MEKLTLSGSPHIRKESSTSQIMIEVCVALLPACVAGVIWFGLSALYVLAIAALAAILSELLYGVVFNRKKLSAAVEEFDCTSLVTGMLIGMNMPANIEWYIPIMASVFAIMVVKMLFGGTGKNFVNPAVAGRLFVFMSFMTSMNNLCYPISNEVLVAIKSSATPLSVFLETGALQEYNLLDMFIGRVPGTLGETSTLALLLGGVYLSVRRIIDFKLPLIYIGVTGLTACAICGTFDAFLPSILGGGLMLGAIFMATDYVTTPSTQLGNIIYFISLGLLTAILRYYKGAEVVSYVIMLMNLTVPLFDKYVVKKPFGSRRIKAKQS